MDFERSSSDQCVCEQGGQIGTLRDRPPGGHVCRGRSSSQATPSLRNQSLYKMDSPALEETSSPTASHKHNERRANGTTTRDSTAFSFQPTSATESSRASLSEILNCMHDRCNCHCSIRLIDGGVVCSFVVPSFIFFRASFVLMGPNSERESYVSHKISKQIFKGSLDMHDG